MITSPEKNDLRSNIEEIGKVLVSLWLKADMAIYVSMRVK